MWRIKPQQLTTAQPLAVLLASVRNLGQSHRLLAVRRRSYSYYHLLHMSYTILYYFFHLEDVAPTCCAQVACYPRKVKKGFGL